MSDFGRGEPIERTDVFCYHCEREIELGEVCLGIEVQAQQFNSDSSISILGAEQNFLVCVECAADVQQHTLERPFAELLKHFGSL